MDFTTPVLPTKLADSLQNMIKNSMILGMPKD
jgi:hypothetical protein